MRRVVCAANQFMGHIVLGARHFDSSMHRAINDAYGKYPPKHEDWHQGFIDQNGNYMSREEAWKVAEAAGQIIRRVGGDGDKLYSENLY